jgi:hypothetical protein
MGQEIVRGQAVWLPRTCIDERPLWATTGYISALCKLMFVITLKRE